LGGARLTISLRNARHVSRQCANEYFKPLRRRAHSARRCYVFPCHKHVALQHETGLLGEIQTDPVRFRLASPAADPPDNRTENPLLLPRAARLRRFRFSWICMNSLYAYRDEWLGNVRRDLIAGLVVALALNRANLRHGIIASISVRNRCRRVCLPWISRPKLENVRWRMMASHMRLNQIRTSHTSDYTRAYLT